ncbi:hypothetical protein [Bacillus sp. 2205SS5-2]|uniref:hypothetical protein n=1 Tax=Bacillus sp. 2205SS5-2 TaxID=3109031 RepID=UPI003004EA31
MTLRFGIDIDGTVTCPSTLLPYINKSFNKNITLKDVTQYDLSKALDIHPSSFSEWFKREEATIYQESPLAENAKHVLSTWKEQFQLYFISARPKHLAQLTEKWFSEQDIMYHHIELIGSHNKIATAKKHNVNLFLEDKHDNAVMLHEELDIPVLLFNTPYNQDSIPQGVKRVNNWIEAQHWVQNWTEEKKQR